MLRIRPVRALHWLRVSEVVTVRRLLAWRVDFSWPAPYSVQMFGRGRSFLWHADPQRGKGAGYSGIENALFDKDNCRMPHRSAQQAIAEVITHSKALEV